METIDTRNQTAHIDPDDLYAILVKANAGIEDRDRKIEDQKAIIYAMSGGQGERIVSANKTLQKRIAKKDQEISKQREVIERFELHESMVIGNLREINTKLHKTIRSQDDTICEMVNEIDELESELGNMKQQLNERHELLQHMTSRDWKQSNEIVGMKVSHGKERVADRKTIKELKAKLADRERQFNELDAILARTRNAFLDAKWYVTFQKKKINGLEAWIAHKNESDDKTFGLITHRDIHIEKLEAELSARKEASAVVDQWHFQVGDKVVSTDHAKRTESIYIEGHVVRVYGDILFVDVGGHIESVSFSWMEKV